MATFSRALLHTPALVTHQPRALWFLKRACSYLRLVWSGAHIHILACSMAPFWEVGRTIPVRQRKRPTPRELAEAAQPCTALKGLSWDQTQLLSLCLRHSSLFLLTSFSSPSPPPQGSISLKHTHQGALARAPSGQEHVAACYTPISSLEATSSAPGCCGQGWGSHNTRFIKVHICHCSQKPPGHL